MMLKGHTGGWSLFFMAAILPGAHLRRNDSSVQPASDSEPPSAPLIYRPVLQPSESVPPAGTFMLRDLSGKPCIKATLGAEYIVIEKKTWYFNLDPSRVRVSGYCGREVAVLSLTLQDNSGSLLLKFKKEKKVFYVTQLYANLSPQPVCQGCPNKTYTGLLSNKTLFKTANGQSFSCKSESVFSLSSQLKVKLVPLKMQAFGLPKGQYGKEWECWADYNKRVIPIIIGATLVGLILIAMLTFLIIRDRRRRGYDTL